MRVSRLILAVGVALVGLLWIGQREGIIAGSLMTGNDFWAAAGVVLVVIAIAILLRERRPTPRG
ncbi:MAG: hypothetical protein ACRDF7_00120 [Candidatus Limnocylindrales bacterium]